MSVEILLILSIIPSIILGWITYKNDRIEKEPTSLLVGLFFSGIGAIGITTVVTLILEQFIPYISVEDYTSLSTLQIFIVAFFGVGFVEEGSKYLMVRSITWKNDNFKHVYDAIVYCVFVSLGFATLENIVYVLSDGTAILAALRGILSIPGHTFFAIFMGYHYGLAKEHYVKGELKEAKKESLLAWVIPSLLHGFFDFSLMQGTTLSVGIYIIFIVFLYIISFKKLFKVASVQNNFVKENNTQSIFRSLLPKKRFCNKCGSPLKENANFCFKCGNKIE